MGLRGVAKPSGAANLTSLTVTPGATSLQALAATSVIVPAKTTDVAAASLPIKGGDAYPQATVNTAGGNLILAGGIGRRIVTVVDYSLVDAGVDTITLVVNGTSNVGTASATPNTATTWQAATSNAITATNIATWVSQLSGLSATAVGAVVYITPAAATYSVTLATSMAAGEGTVTSGTDGFPTVSGSQPRILFADTSIGRNGYIGMADGGYNLVINANDGGASILLQSAGITRVTIDSNGAVVIPAQPAFLAFLSGSALNVTGNNTDYTVICDTEVYDQAANYNNASGVFTAPVAGRYHFTGAINCLQVGTATDFVATLVASNRTFVTEQLTMSIAVTISGKSMRVDADVDMDAADTATMKIKINGIGADTADVQGHASTLFTYFSGRLVC